MAIQQVVQLSIKGVQGVVGGFKKVFNGARGLFKGFGELKNSLIQNLTPAFEVFIGANERLNLELLKTQGNVAASSRVIDQYGNEITDLRGKIEATRPALRKALLQLEEDTRELVGVTTQQVNEAFSIVLENIGRLGGQSKEFADPLESAIALSRGIVASLGAIGLPLQQVRQEFRALIQGDLRDRNAILAQTLNISRREFDLAKSNGELVDFLNAKLQVFIETNKLQAQTITGIASNILDVFQIVTRELGAPLLQPITKQLKVLDNLLQENRQSLVKGLVPSFEILGRIIGQVIDIFNSLVAGIIAIVNNRGVQIFLEGILFTVEAIIEPIVQLLSVLQQLDSLSGVFNFEVDRGDNIQTFAEDLDDAVKAAAEAARELNEEFDEFIKKQGLLSDVTVDATAKADKFLKSQLDIIGTLGNAVEKQLELPVERASAEFEVALGEARDRIERGLLTRFLPADLKENLAFQRASEDLQRLENQARNTGNVLGTFFDIIGGASTIGPSEGRSQAVNVLAEQQSLQEDLEKLQQNFFDRQRVIELFELNARQKAGDQLSAEEKKRLRERREDFNNFFDEAEKLIERRSEGLSGSELRAFRKTTDEFLRGLKAQAKETNTVLGDQSQILNNFFEDQRDIGTQAREIFEQLGPNILEGAERNPEELSKRVKEFTEAINTGIDFGSVSAEEAIEQIDAILGRQRLLFSDQIALLEARNKIIKQTISDEIDLLELQIETFDNLREAGTIDDFTASVATLGVENDKARKEIERLNKEIDGLNTALVRTRENAIELAIAQETRELTDLGFTSDEIARLDLRNSEEVQKRAADIIEEGEGRTSRLLLQARTALQKEEAKIRANEIKANQEFFKERTRQLDEFIKEQNAILDQSIQVRKTQEIALNALLQDSAIERRDQALKIARETEEERLEILLQGLEGRVNTLREAPTLTVEEEREGLLDIEEKITEILAKQNDLFQNAVDQARAINELRAEEFETLQEIEALERDTALEAQVTALEQQSTLLDTGLNRLTALADLDKARLEFTEAQNEQRQRERELAKEVFDLQLELIRAQREGSAEEIKTAREAVQERAKELGIRISVFESEQSIRRKIAAQERQRLAEQRDSERDRLEQLQAEFQAERRQQAVQQEQERIENQIAQTQAQANLANQEAELASLRFQREQIINQRESINIALEQQKVELEAAKARLLAIKEEIRARIEGEGIVSAARQAAEAAAAQEGDPRDAVGGFLDQLNARIDAGIEGIDSQVSAIDEQIAANDELTQEQQLQLDALNAQIEAKEAAIEATKQQISFLKEEAQAQEEINRILNRTLQLRQRATAASAGFEDRNLQRQAERAAARGFSPGATVAGVESGERRRRARNVNATAGRRAAGFIEEGVSRGVDNAIARSNLGLGGNLFRDPRNLIEFGSGFGDATQQARLAGINRDIQNIRREVQAAQPANNTTINNTTTVQPVQVVNPSASSRKSGR